LLKINIWFIKNFDLHLIVQDEFEKYHKKINKEKNNKLIYAKMVDCKNHKENNDPKFVPEVYIEKIKLYT